MYTLLSPNIWKFTLIGFGLLVLLLWWTVEAFGLSWSAFRTVGAAVSTAIVVTWLLFGMSGFYSPWRVIWRKFPVLNEWIYPDLNGVWLGTTWSNWPVIEQVRNSASTGEAMPLGDLGKVPLKEGAAAIEIKASLFKVAVLGSLASTGGRSYSLSTKASRVEGSSDVALTYVYRQETPDPEPTDESMHLGAASLIFENTNESDAKGTYWTRRKWREGMNTAGKIELGRHSEHHVSRRKKLSDYLPQEDSVFEHRA